MRDEELGTADEVRYALWGGVDADADRVGVQIAQEGPSGPAARRVAGNRRIRDVLLRVREHEAPADLKEWLREQVAQRKPSPAEEYLDVTWIQAQPMEFADGLRGADDGNHDLTVAFGDWVLKTKVHEDPDRVCTVTGRIFGQYSTPATGRTVTLFIDHREVASVFTDDFGEFQFPPRSGASFGIRIQYGDASTHVSLVDFDHPREPVNGAGPAR